MVRSPSLDYNRRLKWVVRVQLRGFFHRMVDRWEERGVYVPGEDNRVVSPLRDFGWLIAGWLLTVGLFVIFFAVAA